VYLWIIQLLCLYFEPTTSAVKECIKIAASVTGQNTNAYMVLVGNPEKPPLEDINFRWYSNTQMHLK
jgi:hypothetical protein